MLTTDVMDDTHTFAKEMVMVYLILVSVKSNERQSSFSAIRLFLPNSRRKLPVLTFNGRNSLNINAASISGSVFVCEYGCETYPENNGNRGTGILALNLFSPLKNIIRQCFTPFASLCKRNVTVCFLNRT